MALIAALEYLKDARASEAEFRLDSELVVRQLNGEYKVKEPRLQALYGQGIMLRHVRREQNKRADELANEALDAKGA